MSKADTFNDILEIVARETEIETDVILSSCRRREVVDARYMLVNALQRHGFYNNSIATMMNLSIRAVEIMTERFQDRQEQSGFMFKLISSRISKHIRSLTAIND